jgi:energy-coupling factor transporter ATP-binding protein EcfA2
MIESRGLTKRYGDKLAVDDLSFTVRPGKVTGFLGPNGAGKTTTMRMILGLDRPTAGSVTVHGKPFAELYSAMREVGALLDAKAVHGGRSAFAVVTLTISLVTSFADFFVGQAILSGKHYNTTLGAPGVLRAVLLSAGIVAVFGLFAYGAGAIIRNTAGAISSILGFIFLIPLLAQALPNAWFADLQRWLPGGGALEPIARSVPPLDGHLFSAWGEFAVFSGYAAVLLAVGAWLFLRRDA